MIFLYEGCSLTPCIYEIINTHNNRRYVGQTKEPKNRWIRGHAQSLIRGVHKNKYLQADFNKCFKELGHTDFLEFRVLEALPKSTPEKRDKRELYWMRRYKRKLKYELYNLTEECGPTHSMTEETKKLISQKKKEYYQTKEGKELINKLAADKLGKTYEELYGEEKAEEVKKKIRDNKLIEMNKPEVKQNLYKLLSGKSFEERFGTKERVKEIKDKMRNARKGKYLGKESSRYLIVKDIILISPDGIIYTEINGIKDFALQNNLSAHHLSELLNGKRKSHKGWTLKK